MHHGKLFKSSHMILHGRRTRINALTADRRPCYAAVTPTDAVPVTLYQIYHSVSGTGLHTPDQAASTSSRA